MEEARKKLRICLFVVVTLAVIVGCIYYFGDRKNSEDVSAGTLVKVQQTEGMGREYGGRK